MVMGRERPPFESGNSLALIHGASSERAVAERAKQVHAELEAVAPWLREPHFAPALQRYLGACSRERLLHEWIEEMAAERGAGAVPSRTWEQATAAARLAAKLGQDLGLDPIGHARLKAVAATAQLGALSLAELADEGRRARAGRLDVIDQEPTR
jgi:hypothetical protein